jgi:hypothetical protein
LRAESIYRAGVERATNLRDAVTAYEVAVSEASRTRAEHLHAALRDDDAAMSHATEAFKATFREADELGGGTFNESSQADVGTSEAPEDDTGSTAARTR